MPIIDGFVSITDRHVFESGVQLRSLAISSCMEDLSFLHNRYKEAKWTLYTARTYREGMSELRWNRVPAVLCDSNLPDGNWKNVLSEIALMPDQPRLIVFSRHADEHLWAEVLNLGGFDLLATPFRDEDLISTIGSAWLDWKGEREPLRGHSEAQCVFR